jgi:hypothetical protein
MISRVPFATASQHPAYPEKWLGCGADCDLFTIALADSGDKK